MLEIHHKDNLDFLRNEPNEKYDLIFLDPPFNTGRTQKSHRNEASYTDKFQDFKSFLQPRLQEAHRILKDTGTIYLHLDYRETHRARFMMDEIFGEDNFLNEIIWSYNFGGRGKDRWPMKHDNILVYVKQIGAHIFNWNDIKRIPYKAPELQRIGRSPDEAAKRIAAGQVPTDVWEMSIVGTQAKERTGYPTQKPVKLIERAIEASSPKGGIVLDFFCGSGTTGEAAMNLGRDCVLVDMNPDAIETMKRRFGSNANFY